MTTREHVLAKAPHGLTVSLLADLIRRCADNLDLSNEGNATAVAAEALAFLAGSDDEPGPLDRYDVQTLQADGEAIVIWYCPVCHHVGIIARDFDGDQSDLTLGEILGAVLDHEQDSHR